MTLLQMTGDVPGHRQRRACGSRRASSRPTIAPDGTRTEEPRPDGRAGGLAADGATPCATCSGRSCSATRWATSRAPGPRRRSTGYQIAGKTGTAQQINPGCGCYYDDVYWITFAGMAPADDPRYVVGIMIDNPHRSGRRLARLVGRAAVPQHRLLAAAARERAAVGRSRARAADDLQRADASRVCRCRTSERDAWSRYCVNGHESAPRIPSVTAALERTVGLTRCRRAAALLERRPPHPDRRAVTGVHPARPERRAPGDLFAALPGATAHGARYAADAVARGAVAVLTDQDGWRSSRGRVSGCRCWSTPTPRAVLGELSAAVYGNPSRAAARHRCHRHLRQDHHHLSGRGGPAGGGPGGRTDRHGRHPHRRPRRGRAALTTPEAPDLQALLARDGRAGVDTVVMEVSSHALTLGRVDGVRVRGRRVHQSLARPPRFPPDDARTTSTPRRRLFDPDSPTRAAASVICVDDEWGRAMAAPRRPIAVTVAADGTADWTAEDDPHGRATACRSSWRSTRPACTTACEIGLPGRYNVANGLLAVALLDAVGVSPEQAAPGLRDARPCPAGWSRSTAASRSSPLVDYAHKPGALRAVLETLREPGAAGRLAVVFGAGGNRDAGKRGPMGQVAAERGRPGGGHRRQSARRGSGRHPGRGPGGAPRARTAEVRRDRGPARGHRPRGGVGAARGHRADRRQGARGGPDQPRAAPGPSTTGTELAAALEALTADEAGR